MVFPKLPSVSEVSSRLKVIFPDTFPDRSILVGDMASRLTFVALYGGFIEGTNNWFRPATVISFSLDQAALTSDEDRQAWLSVCQAPGFEPIGKPWYMPNTREPLRDDLIRNRCVPMGIIVKRSGKAITSPAPIYALSRPFSALLNPDLQGEDLAAAISEWQEKYLDERTLRRAALLATGVKSKEGQVVVSLTGQDKLVKLGTGEAATITKDVCEVLAPKMFGNPVVVHISHSDKKKTKVLEDEAKAIGLELDTSAELPDVIFVDVADEDFKICFVEVVHSDGAITELRKTALLEIAQKMGFKPGDVRLITAFDDRSSTAFKKRIGELAFGTEVWFRTEPDMVLSLRNI